MPYRFVAQAGDYSDLASGKVLYHLPGHPAFPVRLASEIFLRAMQMIEDQGMEKTIHIYDPCCGNAYLCTILGFLHGEKILQISASDIDPDILEIARRNLSLLSPEGLETRQREIESMMNQFGKASHKPALESAGRLKSRLDEIYHQHIIKTTIFQADALQPQTFRDYFATPTINLVITDIPYGRTSHWKTSPVPRETDPDPTWVLLEGLQSILVPGAVVAVASAKGVKILHPNFSPAGKMRTVGKRLVTFLRFS